MRILYGVVGEGMGHAIRSRVVIDHLIKAEGHEVQVVVSGRAHDVLESYFPNVHGIWGLEMTYKDNQFKVIRSIVQNAKNALDGIPRNIKRYFEVTRSFRPDCVISDFESWSYLFGQRHMIPVISLDNIQMVARCRHPKELTERKGYNVTKNFVKGKLPGCRHYYVTTFFYPEVRKKRTTLVPPVLRNEILEKEPTESDHVLVYVTSESSERFLDVLEDASTPFLVYGMRQKLERPVVRGNITMKPFDEKEFIDDLASARAVVANGGFTLLSESVYLRKPVFSIPVQSQFEQVVNGYYLDRSGYGCTAPGLSAEPLDHFFSNIDRYRKNLSSYDQSEGNQRLFRMLDEHLDRIAGRVD